MWFTHSASGARLMQQIPKNQLNEVFDDDIGALLSSPFEIARLALISLIL
jgi:hypothetical protein